MIRKASLRADDLQQRSNNTAALARLVREEKLDVQADQLEALADAYREAADVLRQRLKSLTGSGSTREPT